MNKNKKICTDCIHWYLKSYKCMAFNTIYGLWGIGDCPAYINNDDKPGIEALQTAILEYGKRH